MKGVITSFPADLHSSSILLIYACMSSSPSNSLFEFMICSRSSRSVEYAWNSSILL